MFECELDCSEDFSVTSLLEVLGMRESVGSPVVSSVVLWLLLVSEGFSGAVLVVSLGLGLARFEAEILNFTGTDERDR